MLFRVCACLCVFVFSSSSGLYPHPNSSQHLCHRLYTLICIFSGSPQLTTLFNTQLLFTMYTAIFTTLVVAASLSNAVRVTSPTDDSLWQSGSSQTISWESVSTDPQQFDIQLVNQVSDGSEIDWWIRARGPGRRTRLYDEIFGS